MTSTYVHPSAVNKRGWWTSLFEGDYGVTQAYTDLDAAKEFYIGSIQYRGWPRDWIFFLIGDATTYTGPVDGFYVHMSELERASARKYGMCMSCHPSYLEHEQIMTQIISDQGYTLRAREASGIIDVVEQTAEKTKEDLTKKAQNWLPWVLGGAFVLLFFKK